MFSPQMAGKKCPHEVLRAILSLLDDYPPELAGLMIVRRFPPPLAGTFMFTLRDMNAACTKYTETVAAGLNVAYESVDKGCFRGNYLEKAAAVISVALCWMKDFAAAERCLREIPDAKMRSAVQMKLNHRANAIGWSSTAEVFQ